MTTFGSWLRTHRTLMTRLDQKDLAALVGISSTYMSEIETGRKPPPSDDILEALGFALDVHTDLMYWRAGRWPRDLRDIDVPPERPLALLAAFRKALRGEITP